MSEAAIHTILWLIPGAPLMAAVVIALLGPKWLRERSHWPCWIGLGAAAACALTLWWRIVPDQFADHTSTAVVAAGYRWLEIGSISIDLNLRADAISALMLTMVTTVSTLVAIFAAGYMHHDPGYPRFFGAFSLFVFSMVMLVLSANYLQLFVFWEGVGLCSYLLIGFWYRKPAAAAAAKKAFVVNRIGDFGFLLGIFLIWTTFGSLDFETVLLNPGRIGEVAAANPGTILTICLLLLLGAMGKSAQFPLHVWLPDAMEGPTPVSALIHAATMVTAGVYLVARSTPLFLEAPEVQVLVSCIGAVTALVAALIALTQNDLKRVLAYSTVSQLGYMFMALGAGAAGRDLATAAVTAAMFHLFTHGFFKALLFLAAGSVMHSMGDVIDMRRFSGLRRALPTTHLTFLAGAAALAGFPLLAGFWSKDEILAVLSHAGSHPRYGGTFRVVFWVATVTAFLTAFYTFRAYFLTFWGKEQFPAEAGHHPHDAPPVMAWPLRLLAIAAVGIGAVAGATHAFAHYIAHAPGLPAAESEHRFDLTLMVASGLVAVAGMALAWFVYARGTRPVAPPAGWLQPLYQLSLNKFYLDELFYAAIVAPLRWLSHVAVWVDNNVVDRAVDLVGATPRWISAAPRFLQGGIVPSYALMMWAGLLICLLAVTAFAW
ncbi:MAG TPA: NADH-quinone oxidoreductase subunit L [Lacipirellulaceae bacterium]|nr:NADH-quinone oxidoreductase subunit L [Lacipirellulaceae bacterium]